MSGLTMLALLNCCIIAGVTAEVHYRLKNSIFCIQVGKSQKVQDLLWTFNDKVIVIDKQVKSYIKDKVTYNSSGPSLCVNNLTETDSGTYNVVLMDNSSMTSTEYHILKVQETVPRPVIRMSEMRSNLSEMCNIMVNCSVQDDWTWTLCDVHSCLTSQRSHTQVNISIDIRNRTITCTGNNHVSTSRVSQSIDRMCFNRPNEKPEEMLKPPFVIGVAVTVGVIMVCVIVIWATKCGLSRRKNHFQVETPPAQSIQGQPTGAHREPRVSTTSSEANVSYENVDTVQSSLPSMPREELDFSQSQTVDTVYSFLQMPNANRGKDARSHTDVPETSTSPSVARPVDEQPSRADTVYSVLEKTKHATER